MSDQEGERENLAIGTLSVNQRATGSEFRKMDLDSPGASGVIIVRFGSKGDENGPSAPGPFSDLKLTQFGRNRTLGHEGLFSGRQRTSEGTPLHSRS